MKKLFVMEDKGGFHLQKEGVAYGMYNVKTNKWHTYDQNGNLLENYNHVLVDEQEVDDVIAEQCDNGKLQFNKYGIACADRCLVDIQGNALPDTELNCEDDCGKDNRYFVFTLLDDEQCASIDECGTADGITLNYYDTKTREYVLKGIPECRLCVCFFDGEPEVVRAAAELIDEFDSVDIQGKGTIIGRKNGWITVYDYYMQ